MVSTPAPREPAAQRLWRWVRRSSIRRKILGIVLIGGVVPVAITLLLLWFGMNKALDDGVGQFLAERTTAIAAAIDERLEAAIADAERAAAVVAAHGPERLGEDSRLVWPTADAPTPLTMHLTEERSSSDAAGDLVIAIPLSAERAWVVSRYPMSEIVDPLLPLQSDELWITVINDAGLPVSSRGREPERLFDHLLVAQGDALRGWERSEAGGNPQIVAFSRVRAMERLRVQGAANSRWLVIGRFDIEGLLSILELEVWSKGAVGLVVVALFLGLAIMLAHRIIQPLRMMSHEATEIAAGNFDLRLEVNTNDELQELAEHMNTMALRLDSTLNDLEGKLRLLREKTTQLETVAGISRAISKAFDRPHLLRVFEQEVRRCVAFDMLWVVRLTGSDGHGEITHVAWGDLTPSDDWAMGKRIPLHSSRLGRAVDKRRASLAVDLEHSRERHWEDEPLRALGIRSVLVIPLASPDMVHGAVGFGACRPAQLGALQADLLGTACVQLAIGLEHAELHREVQTLADALESKVRERTEALHLAQRRLFQQEKFAATGQLAANVAHEINNPLAIIKNHLTLLQGSAEDEGIHVIREEIDRIARIVNSLLSLYRPSTSGALEGQVDLNAEVETLARLVQRGLEKRGIGLEIDLAADLPAVKGSSDIARQVILNLLRNAEDAMGEGDTLRLHTAAEDGSVALTVSDTGTGIAPEHLNKIFDPFFTTKEESGTGLGLSVTFGIVESLGGSIEVESEVGRGTTFTVRLPAA